MLLTFLKAPCILNVLALYYISGFHNLSLSIKFHLWWVLPPTTGFLCVLFKQKCFLFAVFLRGMLAWVCFCPQVCAKAPLHTGLDRRERSLPCRRVRQKLGHLDVGETGFSGDSVQWNSSLYWRWTRVIPFIGIKGVATTSRLLYVYCYASKITCF